MFPLLGFPHMRLSPQLRLVRLCLLIVVAAVHLFFSCLSSDGEVSLDFLSIPGLSLFGVGKAGQVATVRRSSLPQVR